MTNLHVKQDPYIYRFLAKYGPKANSPDCPENPSTGYAD